MLRRPRWIGLTLLVVVLVVTFVELGQWQLRRHDERAAFNAAVSASLASATAPVGSVLAVNEPITPVDEWRAVEAVGTYDVDGELLVRNRAYEGSIGYEVLTPLVTVDGTALLVDRGWVPAGDSATDVPVVPPPPGGEVTIEARVLAGTRGGAGAEGLPAGQVRQVAIPAIAADLPYPVYGAYAALLPGEPGTGAADQPPRAIAPPEISAGPHRGYAVQWFLFALVAVVGWFVLLRADTSEDAITNARLARRARPVDRPDPARLPLPPAGKVRT